MNRALRHWLLAFGLLPVAAAANSTEPKTYPLWDAHSHYSLEDSQHFSQSQIIGILDQNKVEKILITGTPNSGTLKLLEFAPERVIAFLSVYRTKADKRDWMHRMQVVDEAKSAIATGRYQGIGELHIFAKDKKSPVLRGLVDLAVANDLPMLIHADAEVIDEVFAIQPTVRVLWAHLGTQPEIPLLSEMLAKYPQNLFIDTSVRDKQLLANGGLAPEWRQFLMAHQERLLVAIDTFSVNRWNTYHTVVADIQQWLGDLPPEVAQKLANGNAKRFFRRD